MLRVKRRFNPWVLLCLLVVPSPAFAQGRADVNAGQFDFSLPGARSLGMAGAFLAVARDATAAYSNPAGLIFLSDPEISVEVRNWEFTNSNVDRGHGFGDPSGIGRDTVPGLVEKDFTAETTDLSFLSFVYPRRNWAAAVFQHRIPSYRTKKVIEGPFFDCSGGYRTDQPPMEPFCNDFAREDGIDRLFPKEQEIELDISSIGLSFAYRFQDIGLSLGISALYYDFEMDAVNRVYSALEEQKFAAPNYADDNLFILETQQGDDNELGINIGFIWDSRRWSIGGAYRQGPEFQYHLQRTAGPQFPVTPGEVRGTHPEEPFNVPDTWALGVAFKPSERTTLSLQYDLVEFSQLTDDFIERGQSPPEAEALNNNLTTDDADRIRFGAEHLLLGKGIIWALRAGVWWDSEHRTEFLHDPETGNPAPRWALLFPEGDDVWHYTGGVGAVFSRNLQLDVAFDLSEVIDTYSVSLVWRLSKKTKRPERPESTEARDARGASTAMPASLVEAAWLQDEDPVDGAGGAEGSGDRKRATYPKEFRDGVRSYRQEDWERAWKLMDEAIHIDREDEPKIAFPEDLTRPAIYVPHFYLGAAKVNLDEDADACRYAQERWEPIKADPSFRTGEPTAAKAAFEVELEDLEWKCEGILGGALTAEADEAESGEEQTSLAEAEEAPASSEVAASEVAPRQE